MKYFWAKDNIFFFPGINLNLASPSYNVKKRYFICLTTIKPNLKTQYYIRK